jgi:N-glycosylase/DNA lyase
LRTKLEISQAFELQDYDLAATLSSGQAVRWRRSGEDWLGVIGKNWVRLRQEGCLVTAETANPVPNWDWLTGYLQTHVNLNEVLATFPDDEPMRAAVAACRGLRLLRQDPWECLASFILSSTKQIVQIQQIVGLLCERFGEPITTRPSHSPEPDSPSPQPSPQGEGEAPAASFARGTVAFAFPSPERLAQVSEADLRDCKMGFRAPYLRSAAMAVASGQLDAARLSQMPPDQARAELMKLHGVGAKITDCVLLFAGGFPSAFPVDVWVIKALRQLYFPRRRVDAARLRRFADSHFGPHAGYAQQYLFHYMRTRGSDE